MPIDLADPARRWKFQVDKCLLKLFSQIKMKTFGWEIPSVAKIQFHFESFDFRHAEIQTSSSLESYFSNPSYFRLFINFLSKDPFARYISSFYNLHAFWKRARCYGLIKIYFLKIYDGFVVCSEVNFFSWFVKQN